MFLVQTKRKVGSGDEIANHTESPQSDFKHNSSTNSKLPKLRILCKQHVKKLSQHRKKRRPETEVGRKLEKATLSYCGLTENHEEGKRRPANGNGAHIARVQLQPLRRILTSM